jgi:hypothetical protein
MDWYTPPAQPPPPPPVSALKVFVSAFIPPAMYFIFMYTIVTFMGQTAFFANTDDTKEMTVRQLNEAYSDFVASPEGFTTIISASVYAGLLGIAVFTVMYRRRRPPFAPKRKICRAELLLPAASIAIAGNLALATTIAMIQELLGTDLPVSSLEKMLGGLDEAGLLLIAIHVVLVAPIAEELCFRGLVLNRLMAVLPFWKANVVQAALFGLIHLSPIQSIYAFLFGLLLGWIYHKTGRFSAAIAAHIAFNSAPALTALIPEAIQESPVSLFLIVGVPAAAVFFLLLRFLAVKLKPAAEEADAN